MIAVRLDHFGPPHLQIRVHLNGEGFEEALERRIARGELDSVAAPFLARRDVVAVLDVFKIERGGQGRDPGVERRVFA